MEQSQIARYWYEGSPRGWNRIARVVAAAKNLDRWELARRLALTNMAMADGFIAGWSIRYHSNFWRPVTAIRLADADGNPATAPDPTWETFLNSADLERKSAAQAPRLARAAGPCRTPLTAILATELNGTPHSRQNLAGEGFSCWHRGHFIKRSHAPGAAQVWRR
jgi:hypothetical protein